MERYLNVTEARSEFLDLVEGLHERDRVVITKRGRPRAVLVDFERFALLEDLAWVLQDPGRRAALQQAWNELQRGERVGPTRGSTPTVSSLRRVAHKGRRRRGARG